MDKEVSTVSTLTEKRSSYLRCIVQDCVDLNLWTTNKFKRVFVFRTVVYKDPKILIKPTCECARVHEYFTYIKDGGRIQNDDLDKICDWIDKEECPHVSELDSKHHEIRNTSVTALQVAVACNRSQLYQTLDCFSYYRTGLFDLQVKHIATMKRTYSYFQYLLPNQPVINRNRVVPDEFGDHFPDLITPVDEESSGWFRGTNIDCVFLALRMQDLKLLKYVLQLNVTVPQMWRASLYAVLTCVDKGLIEKIIDFNLKYITGSRIVFAKCVLIATLCGRASLLLASGKYNSIMHEDSRVIRGEFEEHLSSALHVAKGLGEERCVHILRDVLKVRNYGKLSHNPFVTLLSISTFSPDPEAYICLFRTLCEAGYDINKKDVYGCNIMIQACKEQFRRAHPLVVAELLKLGNEVNLTDNSGKTALWYLLRPSVDLSFRVDRNHLKLRVLLYYNPLVQCPTPTTYAEMALALDCYLQWREKSVMAGYVKFDMTKDLSSLNTFSVPLLWECGLPMTSRLLERTDIPKLLREYLLLVLPQPRSLKMQCRDLLRKTYAGRFLHQYVDMIECPKMVKEYILIDYLLKRVEGRTIFQ